MEESFFSFCLLFILYLLRSVCLAFSRIPHTPNSYPTADTPVYVLVYWRSDRYLIINECVIFLMIVL